MFFKDKCFLLPTKKSPCSCVCMYELLNSHTYPAVRLLNVLLKLCAFSHKCTVPSLLSPVNSPRFYILCWITKKLSPQCSKITWRSAYKSSLSSWSRCHGIWLLLFFMRHGLWLLFFYASWYGFYFFHVSWYGFYFFMCHGMAFTFLCVMVWLLLTSVHISGTETQTYCIPLHLPPTVRYRTFLGQCEHITEREIWGGGGVVRVWRTFHRAIQMFEEFFVVSTSGSLKL